MKRIYIEHIKSDLLQIPNKSGIFICYSADTILFFKTTQNLNRFIDIYLVMDTENPVILQLRENCSFVEYQEIDSLFACMIEEKLFIKEHQPYFNQVIKEWSDYSYLSFHWKQAPFIKISHHTIDDYIHIGPFRNEFFIQDVIDTFSNVYKLPHCDSEQYPCEKMEKDICAGYCVFDENTELRSILISLVMTPNYSVLKDLKQNVDSFEDELNFLQAEELSKQVGIIESYYRQLLFLYCSRRIEFELNFSGYTISIHSGLITKIEKEGSLITFEKEDMPRLNEQLAYNKDELNERWIIYSYLESNHQEMIKSLFHSTVQDIQQQSIEFFNQKK